MTTDLNDTVMTLERLQFYVTETIKDIGCADTVRDAVFKWAQSEIDDIVNEYDQIEGLTRETPND